LHLNNCADKADRILELAFRKESKHIKSNSLSLIGDNNYLLKSIPEHADLSSLIYCGRSAEEYYDREFEYGFAKEMYIEVAKSCFLLTQ